MHVLWNLMKKKNKQNLRIYVNEHCIFKESSCHFQSITDRRFQRIKFVYLKNQVFIFQAITGVFKGSSLRFETIKFVFLKNHLRVLKESSLRF